MYAHALILNVLDFVEVGVWCHNRIEGMLQIVMNASLFVFTAHQKANLLEF